ncbi:hypothetical protein FI667_g14656, partial [Globisporangium splendens]
MKDLLKIKHARVDNFLHSNAPQDTALEELRVQARFQAALDEIKKWGGHGTVSRSSFDGVLKVVLEVVAWQVVDSDTKSNVTNYLDALKSQLCSFDAAKNINPRASKIQYVEKQISKWE